jgi:hypothetical protein
MKFIHEFYRRYINPPLIEDLNDWLKLFNPSLKGIIFHHNVARVWPYLLTDIELNKLRINENWLLSERVQVERGFYMKNSRAKTNFSSHSQMPIEVLPYFLRSASDLIIDLKFINLDKVHKEVGSVDAVIELKNGMTFKCYIEGPTSDIDHCTLSFFNNKTYCKELEDARQEVLSYLTSKKPYVTQISAELFEVNTATSVN